MVFGGAFLAFLVYKQITKVKEEEKPVAEKPKIPVEEVSLPYEKSVEKVMVEAPLNF